MKRLFALLLALMLILTLAACGDGSKADTNDNANPSQNEGNKDDGNKNEGNDKLSFTELIAVDNAECFIKITGIEPDNFWGYGLKAQLENKSEDKTYMFSLDTAAINGVECLSMFAVEVAPGKKANESISLMDDGFDQYGVGQYTDIELTFSVYDSNDWLADPVAVETVHVYPYGQEKVTKFVRKAQASDNVLVDNDSVTVIVTGYEQDEIWGYTVNLFLVNKTDHSVMFSADDASVNGFMADPFYATSVSAGKCAFSSMSWSDSTFAENGIQKVNEIEFTLRVHNADDWLSEDLVNEAITLKP